MADSAAEIYAKSRRAEEDRRIDEFVRIYRDVYKTNAPPPEAHLKTMQRAFVLGRKAAS